jgi:uncharacterized lipoprotein YbaY
MKSIVVSGKIQFGAKPPKEGSPVYVRILDTSMSDAPARQMAEQVIPISKSTLNKDNQLPFHLELNTVINPSANYTLAVHVDVDKDGEISKDDYIHRQSYPVITYNNKTKDLLVDLRIV